MKNYKKTVLNFSILIFAVSAILYAGFLFVLPPVLSSDFFGRKLSGVLYKKTGIEMNLTGFKVRTFPALLINAGADKIYLKDKDEQQLLEAENTFISFDLKKFAIKKLNTDYIYVNESGFKNLSAKGKNKKTSDFKIKQFPEVNVGKAEIWVDKGDIESVFVILSNVRITNEDDNRTYCTFEAEIISKMLKNLISIGKKGFLYIDDNALYANDLKVAVGTSEVDINGKIIDDDMNSDFSIKGNNLPVGDAMSSLLYFQKLKDSSKKFIENFYDFSGLTDIDLKINQDGINGSCTAKKLAAKTTLFDVPILFDNVVFELKNREMSAEAFGLLGGEKVYTSFNLTEMGTKNQELKGVVRANLSNKSAGTYVPDLSILGYADTSVDYSVKNKQIYVNYLLKLAQGSDIFYKNAYLGLRDKNRRLLVNTLKEQDKLYINHYDYSVQDGSKIDNIILGDGLMVKKDGHLKPDYITCKTNEYAPVSVTGSFGKYVSEGVFKGDLKYDFNKTLLTGMFNVKNTRYKDFFVENAQIDADEKIMKISANGIYDKSPFECSLEALNNFVNKISIHEMYLFLDEFIIDKNKFSTPKKKKTSSNISEQVKDIDMSVDKWTIKLNKIKRNRIELTDILLTGSLKNNIFNFSVPHVNFAKGILKAEGNYNIKEHAADVYFSANDIDSNTVADVVFNLPNQIEGLANASLHAKTKNGLDDVYANASFSVKQGYLPKLGSTEFIIKTSRKKQPLKFKLSDIVNVDIKNMKALSSDLNGDFYFDNDSIKDVKITSSQKYLSLLIEGNYNLDSQKGNLDLWGKYNNEQITKIKILFVPLSWIVKLAFRPEETMNIYKNKLNEVPAIQAKTDEVSAFRVNVNGNLNKNDLKVELKSIK